MKKTNFNLLLLNGVFVTGLLVSNLFGSKLISLIGFTLPGAVITYPLTFLVTDVIGELWGKQEANQCVRVGFISQLVFLGISLYLPYPRLQAYKKVYSLLLTKDFA